MIIVVFIRIAGQLAAEAALAWHFRSWFVLACLLFAIPFDSRIPGRKV